MHIDPVLHRVAVEKSAAIVGRVTVADLNRPTPCAGWNLDDLLAHMTVQHRGFAAAARGSGSDHRLWDPATVADLVRADPAGSYAAATRDVLEAFSAEGVDDATFALPEFGPGATVPGSVARSMHFVDYLVHGWDVAVTLGLPFEPGTDVIAAALPIVLAIPDDEMRTAPNAPFGHAVAATRTTDFETLLTHLGRWPDWAQPENSTDTGA